MDIDEFITKNNKCYDRFTFDKIFRLLLRNDYTKEEAKEIILHNCFLSILVFQERIYNNYYKQIKIEEEFSEDLIKLKNEIFNKKRPIHFNN